MTEFLPDTINLRIKEQEAMNTDDIFVPVSTSAKNFNEAKEMVALFYVPDPKYPREEICQALKRLEQFFKKSQSSRNAA